MDQEQIRPVDDFYWWSFFECPPLLNTVSSEKRVVYGLYKTRALILLKTLALYKPFTYLLTYLLT